MVQINFVRPRYIFEQYQMHSLTLYERTFHLITISAKSALLNPTFPFIDSVTFSFLTIASIPTTYSSFTAGNLKNSKLLLLGNLSISVFL